VGELKIVQGRQVLLACMNPAHNKSYQRREFETRKQRFLRLAAVRILAR
jgi:hypothetical protein